MVCQSQRKAGTIGIASRHWLPGRGYHLGRGRVIGWSMSSRMTAQLACDALQMALWRRKRPENVIVHTDRGGQYCSTDYQSLLKRHNLRGV